MPTLILRFPARSYHATPWGHHVNEGLIEWPPSPWRLLRALLSVGYTSGLWDSGGPSVEARSLIEKLAIVLPTYSLPPACGAHSRHYMPLATLKPPGKGADTSFVLAHQFTGSPIVRGYKENTTLVLDTWAQVDDGELAVTWDVELSDVEAELLGRLAERLGYLGRAESWVTARQAGADEAIPASNCFHESVQANPGPGWEQVPFVAAENPADFMQWRKQAVAQALAVFPLPETKRPSKKLLSDRKKAEEPYPADLIACLHAETNWLRKYGWSQPPGSRRVFYWRKADALEAGAPRVCQRAIEAPTVEAMLLSMVTASGNDHALPSITRTLAQAELLHRTLVSFSAKQGVHSPVLTGCDESRRPLGGPHAHAHILPLDLDRDGHLDHILVWAPMGLDADAQTAVRAVRRTFTKGGVGSLRMALVGSGSMAVMRGLAGVRGETLRSLIGPSAGAMEWTNATPFVPPRYLKKSGRNTLEGQVIAELAARGYPEPTGISVLDPRSDTRLLRMRHFIRSRYRGPAAPVDVGFSLSLRFAEPINGPLCLGYGCHFGLGMFVAVK